MNAARIPPHQKQGPKKRWPLHQRIALNTGGLVFIMGLVLILGVNIIAPLFISQEVGTPDTMVLVETVDARGNRITALVKTPAPGGYTISCSPGVIRQDPLKAIRTLSAISLALVVGASYFAGRWIAKKSLLPVREIGQVAQKISARTLEQHLNYQGAQDEIKDLADAFDSMLDRLNNNFKQQGQFISNLAHELRTPLTSLHMGIETLQTDPDATLEDYKELSNRLDSTLTGVERLVADLLILARDEMEITQHLITLGVLFEEILEELAPISRKYDVALRMRGETELEIRGDRTLIQRAFSNLIENGIYYNHPGGFVEITIRSDKELAVVEIRDNGIGIPKNQQEYIFERFYRTREASSSRHDGKGLGLAITVHIIRLHQGRIEVDSTPGIGSIFRVFLRHS